MQYLSLNFFDEEGQVGVGEAQVRGRNAMMLDVRWYVLMVGMSGGQRRVVGMRPRIVPVQRILARVASTTVFSGLGQRAFGERRMTSRDFVAVRFNNSLLKVQQFVHAQYTIVAKGHQAG